MATAINGNDNDILWYIKDAWVTFWHMFNWSKLIPPNSFWSRSLLHCEFKRIYACFLFLTLANAPEALSRVNPKHSQQLPLVKNRFLGAIGHCCHSGVGDCTRVENQWWNKKLQFAAHLERQKLSVSMRWVRSRRVGRWWLGDDFQLWLRPVGIIIASIKRYQESNPIDDWYRFISSSMVWRWACQCQPWLVLIVVNHQGHFGMAVNGGQHVGADSNPLGVTGPWGVLLHPPGQCSNFRFVLAMERHRKHVPTFNN